QGAAAAGPPRVLAESRAPQLLGHGRLDRLRVRRALRRRVRVPQPATARTLRRATGVVRPLAALGALVTTGTTTAVLLRGANGSLGPNMLLLTVAYVAVAVVVVVEVRRHRAGLPSTLPKLLVAGCSVALLVLAVAAPPAESGDVWAYS